MNQSDEKFPAETLGLAVTGDAQAQYELGMYYDGLSDDEGDFQPDQENAVMWLKKAVEQGHGPAHISLAEIFNDGIKGIEPNPAAALELVATLISNLSKDASRIFNKAALGDDINSKRELIIEASDFLGRISQELNRLDA
jgi:TPR repeat protein